MHIDGILRIFRSIFLPVLSEYRPTTKILAELQRVYKYVTTHKSIRQRQTCISSACYKTNFVQEFYYDVAQRNTNKTNRFSKTCYFSRHQQIQEIRFYLLSQKAENIFLKKQVSAVRKERAPHAVPLLLENSKVGRKIQVEKGA